MLIVAMFVLVLVATFAIVWVLTRPTKSETLLKERLQKLGTISTTGEGAPDDILKKFSYSDVPVVNLVLQRLALAARLNEFISQANVKWSVGRIFFTSAVLFVAVGWFMTLWLRSAVAGVVVGLAASLGPFIYLRFKRNARFRQFERLLPDAIDLMTRALRAGHAVNAAIEMVSREISDPVGMEFRRAFEEQNYGMPMRDSLTNLVRRVPVADLKFMVTAILVQKETGGNLAEVLDKAAAVIRERSRLLGQLRIYTAQGRLTGWILGALPFIVFAGINFLNPGYARVLIESPIGQKMIWTGLGLMLLGAWVIRKIVDIKV